jgi:hypothetical protein
VNARSIRLLPVSSALLLGVLLSACGTDDDRVATTLPGDTIVGAPATPPGTLPGQTMDPAMAGMAATVQLQPLGDSGVGGEAVITDRGAQVEVMVRLTGTPGNTTHPGHIHSGTCANVGGVVQALEPITTGADGAGTMTTQVDLAPMSVMDGQHVVVYHAAGGQPATCGEIPAHRM